MKTSLRNRIGSRSPFSSLESARRNALGRNRWVAILGGALALAPLASFSQDVKQGEQLYTMNCAACHQPTGTGIPAVYPPLAGAPQATGGSKRAVAIVLNGLQGPITVNGAQYNGPMQPWKAILSDDKIAAILTYVRQAWGNKGTPVTAEQVKAARAEYAQRTSPLTDADLAAIPDEDIKP
ncbi:cytochrome c oxidase cbb3-type subunit III [Methylacidimicrobium cyclopophantes]|uniref:Cytochrome c oxidase cbb3-type subunit III n=1 Tax=Methylacidimicrobium cyclopophantes TaxID=1041766 RepID=A0A5E6MK66_9BACT|nr:cytochrome c [Methylacidimicrobium cyclopophantes]VVM08376.1 cytochrome c oxidase cbb3-type subunit III [Methylacidimicrobium cyclopophantes]